MFDFYDYLVCYRPNVEEARWDCVGNFNSYLEADAYFDEHNLPDCNSTLVRVNKLFPNILRNWSIHRRLVGMFTKVQETS